MGFLLNSQAQGVSGKNEQSTQTPWRGTPRGAGPPEARDPRGAGPKAAASVASA